MPLSDKQEKGPETWVTMPERPVIRVSFLHFYEMAQGPIYLETNTLPGLTKASLYPKALKAQGIEFSDFLRDQIALAERRTHR